MDYTLRQLREMALTYANSRGIKVFLKRRLGYGNDGQIWITDRSSAVKVHYRESCYVSERKCYQIFKKSNITQIKGLSVPTLIDFDDDLMTIEMGIVRRPYLLDFGKAYVDHPPSYYYDAQMKRNFYDKCAEDFPNNIKKLRVLLACLEGMGIYYVDPTPANIDFGNISDD